MMKRSKSAISIDNELTVARNYSKISKSTGISSKRLGEIRKGAKADRKEAAKISAYARKDKEISLKTLSRLSGFSPKAIQERMRYGKKVKTSGKVGLFRESITVGKLHYHLNGTVTAKRQNGQKVIYYVIIMEDLLNNEITVGHGFTDFYVWQRQGSKLITEEVWSQNGKDYERVTKFYNMLSPDLSKEVSTYKYNPKPLEVKKAHYKEGQAKRYKKDK